MFYFDVNLNDWSTFGPATVTEEGLQLCSDPGFGVTRGAWTCCIPPPDPPTCEARETDITAVTASANGETEELVTDINEEINFNAEVRSKGCSSFTYKWDFGDGSPPSAAKSPSHQYKETGEYTVKVDVDCEGECEREDSGQDTVLVGCVTGEVCNDNLFCTSFDGKVPGLDKCQGGVCLGNPYKPPLPEVSDCQNSFNFTTNDNPILEVFFEKFDISNILRIKSNVNMDITKTECCSEETDNTDKNFIGNGILKVKDNTLTIPLNLGRLAKIICNQLDENFDCKLGADVMGSYDINVIINGLFNKCTNEREWSGNGIASFTKSIELALEITFNEVGGSVSVLRNITNSANITARIDEIFFDFPETSPTSDCTFNIDFLGIGMNTKIPCSLSSQIDDFTKDFNQKTYMCIGE